MPCAACSAPTICRAPTASRWGWCTGTSRPTTSWSGTDGAARLTDFGSARLTGTARGSGREPGRRWASRATCRPSSCRASHRSPHRHLLGGRGAVDGPDRPEAVHRPFVREDGDERPAQEDPAAQQPGRAGRRWTTSACARSAARPPAATKRRGDGAGSAASRRAARTWWPAHIRWAAGCTSPWARCWPIGAGGYGWRRGRRRRRPCARPGAATPWSWRRSPRARKTPMHVVDAATARPAEATRPVIPIPGAIAEAIARRHPRVAAADLAACSWCWWRPWRRCSPRRWPRPGRTPTSIVRASPPPRPP